MRSRISHSKKTFLQSLLRIGTFKFQQIKPGLKPASKPGKATISANDAMTGDHNRQWIATICRTYCSDCPGPPTCRAISR